MSTDLREIPADVAAPAVKDEWTVSLQNYTKVLSIMNPIGLEHRRSDFLAHAMISDCETSLVLNEIQKLIDEMRQNEQAAMRCWKVISKITFQSLLQIAQPQSRSKGSQSTELGEILSSNFKDDSQFVQHAELWEPRLRLLLRLALVDRSSVPASLISRPSDRSICADAQIDTSREADFSQCCPLRMLTNDIISSSNQQVNVSVNGEERYSERVVTSGRLAASPQTQTIIGTRGSQLRSFPTRQDAMIPFHDSLYAMPNLTIGIQPGSVPSDPDLRKTIILSALLNNSVKACSIQLLDWACRIVEVILEENRPAYPQESGAEHEADTDGCSKTIFPASLLVNLCLDQTLCGNVKSLMILQEQLTKRWLCAVAVDDPGIGFQVIQRLPNPPSFTKFLIARTYIEAHRNHSFIGDQTLRQVYEQFLNQLRVINERAVLTVYLDTWCCLYDRMFDQDYNSRTLSLGRGSDGDNIIGNALLRTILFARDLSDYAFARDTRVRSSRTTAGGEFEEKVHVCLDDNLSVLKSDRERTVRSEIEKILAYVSESDHGVSRGAFTRAILTTYHHTHKPPWFILASFVVWSSWVGSLLDVPFIPHYIATHQKDFPDTQYALTAMKNYRTGSVSPLGQRTGSLTQLNQLIGATMGDLSMTTVLKSETGLTPQQALSTHAMLLGFLQNCIKIHHL